jgi:hypothetical protein
MNIWKPQHSWVPGTWKVVSSESGFIPLSRACEEHEIRFTGSNKVYGPFKRRLVDVVVIMPLTSQNSLPISRIGAPYKKFDYA